MKYIFTCRGRLFVTYKTGFGLYDWIYWHLSHTTWDYRQYSAISDLRTLQFTVTHALGFSAFTSRILATDLQQSHRHFKSHMKSSLHRIIPFLPFLLSHLRLPSPELDPFLNNSLKWTLLQLKALNNNNCFLGTSRYIASGRTSLKTPSSIVPYCFRLVYWSVA
jgi:hypothetical protein